MDTKDSLLQPARTSWQKARGAIFWWEVRRIPYNLAVGAVGIMSILGAQVIGGSLIEPGEDLIEPLALIFGGILYGVAANACYTLGWILEVLGLANNDIDFYRRRAFRAGLILSCALTSIPLWVTLVAWVIHRHFR
jgi:hypothetical protein